MRCTSVRFPIPPPIAAVARPASGKNAFSLIELLIVIAVISVLLAILFPAVSLVREAADQAKCATHLRQLGSATGMFLAEHDNVMYPHTDYNFFGKGEKRWYDYLRPYIGKQTTGSINGRASLYCPLILSTRPTQYSYTGYGKNGNLGNLSGAHKSKRITEAYPMDRVVLMWDDQQLSNFDGGWPTATWGGGGSWYKLAFRHGGKAHILLMDGHVRSLEKGRYGDARDYPELLWGPFDQYPTTDMPTPP